MITEDKDEELALFLDMTSSVTRSNKNSDVSIETVSSRRRTATENFLYSEKEKSDYDWLLTPPRTPERIVENELKSSNSTPMIHESREDEAREKSKTTSFGSKVKRPSSSSSSKSTNKPSTPTRRSTTPTKPTTRPASSSRATLTTPRATKSTTTRPMSAPGAKPGSKTDTLTSSRATLTTPRATKSTTTRPMSAPGAKPGSRTGTLTSRPSTPTGLTTKPTKPIKPRPWEPFEMPGFSTEAPSNLRTTLPDRASSSSSRRAVGSAPSSRSTSIERPITNTNKQPIRRQSCSPSKARGTKNTSNTITPSLRGRTSINVGEIRNKTIEREVKKLAPSKVTESNGGRGGRGGGGGSSGYGRNLSKNSINMALRHMDIKRGSMIGNLRPVMSKVPVSSMYSVRSSGSKGNRPGSSSGSSESSVNHKNENVIDILYLDGSEASDDLVSERSYT